jgi:hypothetical protein
MTDEERRRCREKAQAAGFQNYYEVLGDRLLDCGDDVADWNDDDIASEFEKLGYIAIDFERGPLDVADWAVGSSQVDDLVTHLLSTGIEFEKPWSACDALKWRKMWFRNERDAVMARLILGA